MEREKSTILARQDDELMMALLLTHLLIAVSAANVVAAAAEPSSSSLSHVVSTTSARLPMSLSTVIQDLEAEGASHITTATYLTSKSVRRSEGSRLLGTLFGIASKNEESDNEIAYGTTSAFGKKFGDKAKKVKDDGTTADGDGEDDTEGDGGSGVAIACPSCSSRHGATASEISSTVVACGGNIVYVADATDLGRGEGLFDYLGPAIERLLAFRATKTLDVWGVETTTTSSKKRPSTLLVVFRGIDEKRMVEAKKQWESAASAMLASIIQPTTSSSTKAVVLSDVFDRIEYLNASEINVEMRLCPAGGSVSSPGSPSARAPDEVASSVSDVVNAGLVEDLGPMVDMSAKVPSKQKCPKLTNPVDLAAARLLGPLARKALGECLDVVRSATGEDGAELVTEFGSLADAAIRRALDTLDTSASSPRFKKSIVAKRIRVDLRENLYAEVGDVYERQVAALRDQTFAMFRGRLNKLRIGPNLPNQMQECADMGLTEFGIAVKKLRVPRATSYGSWMTNADQILSLRSQFAEHNTDRLRAARASGQFRPVPRKGVTVGMHWLLPKPFGHDYRQEPHMMHTADDLVYAPVDGITDVGLGEIRTGDWRRGVVPAPAGAEMMYMK